MVSTLLLVGIIAGYFAGQLPFGGAVGGTVTPEPAAGQPAPEAPVVLSDEEYDALSDSLVDEDDHILGDSDAPITVVEFSDFQCPFCARFHTETFGLLKQNYIDTGKIRFVYKDYPLGFHQFAQKASETAECAGEQDKFWEMHEKLFAAGQEWQVDSDTANATFKRYAKGLGLTSSRFDKCLDGGEMAQDVRDDLTQGSKNGVSGTPGFFVQGRTISGAQPYAVFAGALDSLIE